jgi:ribonuclease VapC
MASYVLDASAALAMLDHEPGADMVAEHISDSVISSVNAAEVVTKLVRDGLDPATATLIVETLPCPTRPVDARTGYRAGELYAVTAARGLSLGDRVCIAFAEAQGLPVLTTDRAWRGLPLPIEVITLR